MHSDLYTKGLGAVASAKPTFTAEPAAEIIGSFDFKIPSKNNTDIFVSACLFGPSDTSPVVFPIFGVGLEWKGPCGDAGHNPASSGPMSHHGKHYYVVKHKGFHYHVITSTEVQ